VTDDRSCDVPTDLYLPEVFSGLEWRAGSRGNWFWLVDLPTRGVAVELSLGPPTLDEVSRSRFERVRHFDLTFSGLPLPVTSAAVDCVILRRPWPEIGAPNARALLSECGRLLRGGGCLVMALDHSSSFGRSSVGRWLPRALLAAPGLLLRRWIGRQSWERSSPWPLHAITQDLGRAGFTDVRSYYALPTIDAPQQLIPAQRHAIAVHQAQNANPGMRRMMGRMLLASGLEAALFPGFLLIAVR
jgi:SAM-dependent methyltransferase